MIIPKEFEQVPSLVWSVAQYEAGRVDREIQPEDTVVAFSPKDKFLKREYYEWIEGVRYSRYYAKINGRLWEVAVL